MGCKISAQNCTLSGTVSDSISRAQLFYAVVSLLNVSDSSMIQGTTTDLQGKFLLPYVSIGNYLLKVSYAGYPTRLQIVTVKSTEKEIDLGNIAMGTGRVTLPGFTVTGKKPVYMMDGEKTFYNVSEDPGVQTGTLADALQNAPGIEVDIEGNITLRGVSSVEIWINDKPSRLEAENLKTYIQQMPANSIERIEVISAPSARYSSKGSGGIINIITRTSIKRDNFISFGLNASSAPYISPYISYSYKNKKWTFNIYGSGRFSIWKSNYRGYNLLKNSDKDTSSYQYYYGESKTDGFGGHLSINASYQIDSMNEVTAWYGTWPYFNKSKTTEIFCRSEYFGHPDTFIYHVSNEGQSGAIGGWFGASYDHKFNKKGHKISIDMSASMGGYVPGISSDERVYVTHHQLDKYQKITTNSHRITCAPSLDYSLPYYKDKGEIALGVVGTYISNITENRKDTLFKEEIYMLDSTRYRDLKSDSYDFESYFTIQHKFGNFTVKAGVRGEYVYQELYIFNSPEDNVNGTGYWGMYPSLNMSYRTENMHNFSLSYTRRVSFPSADNRSTFKYYAEESFSTGNPNLEPSFTHNIDMSWNKFFEKFGSIGLSTYYRNTTDIQNTLTDVCYDDYFDRIVTYSYPVNSGKYFLVGGNASVTYRLQAFMNIRFHGGINYSETLTTFREGEDPHLTQNLTYNCSMNFWAKVWKILEIHASTHYRSKSKTLFTETQPGFAVNSGLRADFMNRKISVYLNVNDIFNTNRTLSRNDNPYYITYSTREYNSRSISAGITFRFGKMELESSSS
ncbi:MAG: outer membrane beta-barrel protein [Bacteroidales bacterium]|nr:outer membrane beta-barrel protein [Bacteroidales bacterium]